MAPTRLYIHAPNIHRGGGKVLLLALLDSVPRYIELCLIMDSRLSLAREPSGRVQRVTASVPGRIKADKWLATEVGDSDIVLCFGNLPPLLKLRCRALLFVQNRYLVNPGQLSGFPFKTRLKMRMESLWLRIYIKNVDEVIVQSPSMKSLLDVTAKGTPVNVLPFMIHTEGYSRNRAPSTGIEAREFDFLYVASGEPHKNHRKLISAWCQLANENLYPTLLLTLDQVECSDLCEWIEQKNRAASVKSYQYGHFAWR